MAMGQLHHPEFDRSNAMQGGKTEPEKEKIVDEFVMQLMADPEKNESCQARGTWSKVDKFTWERGKCKRDSLDIPENSNSTEAFVG
ncbi:hypothetical protein HGM15179_001806 [Zosterops borbonicus]|uniref:Uncharacterized protein n=1 Tax=Zosterops borbonicus TaxID=364589 RepID=A0A8K1LT45_9PASS|nr:hypothetical protein HGM15179_001806 [Zosterops borbonicus]